MVDRREYENIIKKYFSDMTLDFLASSDRYIADRFAHTKFSNNAVDRLVKACNDSIITTDDIRHIFSYGMVNNGSERYLNDYFSSIAAGLDTKTASRILVASKFEDWSYIRSAYEIYNKDYIADFCSVNDIDLGSEDLKVLLETDNVLDEIYQEWDSMTQLNGVAEIDTAIEDVAYRLRMERAERQMEETKQAEERITPKPNRKMKL